MSTLYQSETVISLNDVHYAPLCPGERELGIIGNVRGLRTLELACGAAQNSIALTKLGASATAIDISDQQLACAKSLIAQENVRVNLVQGDVEQLGLFHDSCFELVLSCFGMEFLPDPEKCLRECFRVLTDYGLLVISTVHPLTAFEWDSDAGMLCVTDYFNPPVEIWDEPTHEKTQKGLTFFRTIQEMFGLLADAGFQVEQVIEPAPNEYHASGEHQAPYTGVYWESQRHRLSKVPFAIIYKARKPHN